MPGPIAFAGLLVALALLLVATPVEAKFRYSPSLRLSPAELPSAIPQVAVDPVGRATVVWEYGHGPSEDIVSRRIGVDGRAEVFQPLSAQGSNRYPQVAVDGEGRATVVWQRDTGSNFAIESVRLGPDGSPGPIQGLGFGHDPQIAVDLEGNATVVWAVPRPGGNDPDEIKSVRIGAEGTPGAVRTLSEESSGGAGNPQLAVDPQGRVTVVWLQGIAAAARIHYRHLGADGTPEPILVVPGTSVDEQGSSEPLEIAVDPQGRATLAWWDSAGIEAVRLDADGTPSAVHTIAAGAVRPQVAVDPLGRSTVVWEEFGFDEALVKSRRMDSDGTPAPRARTVATQTSLEMSLPHVAVDLLGRATVVWSNSDGAYSVPLRASGAPNGPVHTLSREDTSGAQVAVDPLGRPTVVWEEHFPPDPTRIEAARGKFVPISRITKSPKRRTTRDRAVFKFRSDEPGATFECKLDDGEWEPCTSPKRYTDISPGKHVFSVRSSAGTSGKAKKWTWHVS